GRDSGGIRNTGDPRHGRVTTVIRDEAFETLLLFLRESRGFDFTGYKRSTLLRRVKHRMDQVGISSFPEYHEHLQQHPEEFSSLFNTILINVTSFFRDAEAWEYVSSDILPRMTAAKGAHEPIRAWSAGCASGEEAYTLAMVLVEALGMSQFRERVMVYATDSACVLFVGKAEMLRSRDSIFAPLDLKYRVPTKVGRPSMRERTPPDTIDIPALPNPQVRLRESAFDTALVAQIVVDPGGYL